MLLTWLPRIALAIVFVFAGALKFSDQSLYVGIFDQIGVGDWFRYLTGVIELGGGLMLLVPRAAAVGFILNGCAMAGAVAFWVLNGNPGAAMVPGVLLALVVGFGWAEARRFITLLNTSTQD
jgi:putative oxidoreductase